MNLQNSQNKIFQIDQKIEILKNLRPIKPKFVAKINEKLKLDVNYHSNKIEGNTLTLGETKSLILHQMSASIAKKVRDVEEMRGHIKAYDEFISSQVLTQDNKPLELTEYFIKNLHKIILVEDREDRFVEHSLPKVAIIPAGNWKIHPNSVQTKSGIFHYSEPFQVPILMSDLLNWYNSVRNELNPVILSAIFQYKFLRIHPFGDGNGRMSRFLGNLTLQSGGLVITVFKEQERNKYLNSLNLTDNNFATMTEALESKNINDFEPFIDFVATSLMETLDLVIRGSKGEDITEIEDVLKTLEIKAKSMKIGYSLQDILNDKELLKEQNKQLEKLGNTIDSYIERVLKHKFWQNNIEKDFYGEIYHNDNEYSFEDIQLKIEYKELTDFRFYWNIFCKKPIIEDKEIFNQILNQEYFSFNIVVIFDIDAINIKFLNKDKSNNQYEYFNIQFKYLDAEFETKLKDFILKLDTEIDQIIKSEITDVIMPF